MNCSTCGHECYCVRTVHGALECSRCAPARAAVSVKCQACEQGRRTPIPIGKMVADHKAAGGTFFNRANLRSTRLRIVMGPSLSKRGTTLFAATHSGVGPRCMFVYECSGAEVKAISENTTPRKAMLLMLSLEA